MKRLLFAISMIVATSTASVAQTYTAATEPWVTNPTAATTQVYRPLKTSCYSSDNVPHPHAGGTPYNLYVYSWDGENFVSNGIGWIQRDAAGGILYQGSFPVDRNKRDLSVGIVTDGDGVPHVICSYWTVSGGAGTIAFDAYRWQPTGLIPTFLTVSLSNILPKSRVSMDCYDLKKVVFTWDHDIQYDEDDELEWEPGLRVRAMNINSGAPGADLYPFNLALGNERLIPEGGYYASNPDVAIGVSGTQVTIPFIDATLPLTGSKDINVRSATFANIFTGTGPITSTAVDAIPSATDVYVAGFGKHLKIDAPDNGSDIWSLTYNSDFNTLYARTMPTTGIPVSHTLSTLLSGLNIQPTVAYDYSGTGINYGWYSDEAAGFIATKLNNNGTTYPTGFSSGLYKRVHNLWSINYIRPMSFSKQNDRTNNLFLVYPYQQGTGGNYYDMNSKLIPWTNTSFRPTNLDEANKDNLIIESIPNPFTNGFRLNIEGSSGKEIEVAVSDITGKVILETQGDLNTVNVKLSQISPSIATGIYNVSVKTADYLKVLKVVKQ